MIQLPSHSQMSVKMILDSVSEEGIRLPTMLMRYPRPIHSEMLTHGALAKNSASSRAIPIKRMIEDIQLRPFIPHFWSKHQAGMQASQETDARVWIGGVSYTREEAWLWARDRAIEAMHGFSDSDYHKQLVNRIGEPYMYITVQYSATDWKNFMALRDHHMAEPHIVILAKLIKECMDSSTPKLLRRGEWHMPWIEPQDVVDAIDYLRNGIKINPTDERIQKVLMKLSVARSASTSYKTVDGQQMTFDKAIPLHDSLLNADPMHASPFEHQGTPDWKNEDGSWANPHLHGRFTGFIQYRKTIPGECVPE